MLCMLQAASRDLTRGEEISRDSDLQSLIEEVRLDPFLDSMSSESDSDDI